MASKIFPEMSDSSVGKALRLWRSQGIGSASTVCEKTGLSSGYYSDIENGKRRLNERTALKISQAFGYSLAEFENVLRETYFREAGAERIFINDDTAAYRVKPKVDPLLGLLLEEMDAGQLKDLAHRLVDQALEGDHSARTRVAQLMENLPAEKVR